MLLEIWSTLAAAACIMEKQCLTQYLLIKKCIALDPRKSYENNTGLFPHPWQLSLVSRSPTIPKLILLRVFSFRRVPAWLWDMILRGSALSSSGGRPGMTAGMSIKTNGKHGLL